MSQKKKKADERDKEGRVRGDIYTGTESDRDGQTENVRLKGYKDRVVAEREKKYFPDKGL